MKSSDFKIWLEQLPRLSRGQLEQVKQHVGQAALQHFRCRACKHTFTALTGTPLARLRHKKQWLNYSAAMIQGLTVRASAQHCGIDKNTSFRWRHRFLSVPALTKANGLNGIVEADETYFPHSCKGQRHLERPPRKRGKQIHGRGPPARIRFPSWWSATVPGQQRISS